MSVNTIRSKYLSAAIFALMILALIIKAAIPAGFMPSFEGGFTKMVICSGMGEKTVLVPDDDSSGKAEHEKTSNDICAYQIIAGQKNVPVPSVIISPSFNTETIHYEWTVTSVLKIQHILSLNARGPPTA